jgi:hypothetical protein
MVRTIRPRQSTARHHAPSGADWLRLHGRLLSVLLGDLRLGHPVDLGAEYVTETQDHNNQIGRFVPVPDPFPNDRSHFAGELGFLVLAQELQGKLLVESAIFRPEMNAARFNP